MLERKIERLLRTKMTKRCIVCNTKNIEEMIHYVHSGETRGSEAVSDQEEAN